MVFGQSIFTLYFVLPSPKSSYKSSSVVLSLKFPMFEFANLHIVIFVLERTEHFEFALLLGYDRCPYQNLVRIHYA